MLLRARFVLPIVRPRLDDGVIRVDGNRVVLVGRWPEVVPAAEEVFDLGAVVVLPGLVNAHWIKTITAAKGGFSYADFAQAWLRGAQMLVRSGTTTVADIESVPELLPEVWEATPLRVWSFLEMTGVKSRRDPKAIVDEAARKIESLPATRNAAGLSPHAPYSTVPQLLRQSVATARERGWRLATHVAESDLEFEMFAHARGEMFEWLKRNERDMSDCGHGSPVRHLERNGYLGPNLVAAHVNYLDVGDADLLGRREVSVAHCPRSHAFFRHRPFPYQELVAGNVNVCLGTDSLATVARWRDQPLELNLFSEMQAFADANAGISPESILRMATANAARALGMQGRVGELTEGALADLIAVPFNGKPDEVLEAVLHHRGDVVASMIGGEWVMKPKGLRN